MAVNMTVWRRGGQGKEGKGTQGEGRGGEGGREERRDEDFTSEVLVHMHINSYATVHLARIHRLHPTHIPSHPSQYHPGQSHLSISVLG